MKQHTDADIDIYILYQLELSFRLNFPCAVRCRLGRVFTSNLRLDLRFLYKKKKKVEWIYDHSHYKL